jgi:alcohol dehydrogenase YqhD (iron-dependent ADH family)
MRYCMETDPSVRDRVREFGRNVFGTDTEEDAVAALEKFFYEDLGLASSLSAIDLGNEDFADMAETICKKGNVSGYCPLDKHAVQTILEACR